MRVPVISNVFSEAANTIVFAASSLLIFEIQYYLLKNMPGAVNRACVIGGYFTPENIFFSLVISLLAGIIVSMVVYMMRLNMLNTAGGASGGLGIISSFLAVFCVACSVPFLSLFGISISLIFLNDYLTEIKILSILLILLSLYLLNRQLIYGCKLTSKK